ncbi:MAG TPA: M56 family metallopeptidase [Gemmatimonadaceae bacterium]|nr:M56 family metallopeptidase [Gemmatimonadaceae bacterium]
MIAWMLYALLVSACLFVAASAAEWLLRLRRMPVRLVWITAALGSVLFAAIARFRPVQAPASAGEPVDPSTLALLQSGMRTVQQSVPPSIDPYVVAAWTLAALGVMLAFAAAYRRMRRAQSAWPAADLHGHRVRLSSDVGPVVIGVAAPVIVVPRWIMRRSPAEQRLIVEHEASHVVARDPLLLTAGCVLAALMPWNPVLWMMLSRLRLAIELDCDARLLRNGTSPRAYGALLVDVAESARPLRFAALALSDAASQLQRRILAMESRRITHPIVRGAGVALVGLAGLLAACEAKVPTSADIAKMDASSAERAVQSITPSGRIDSARVWKVDGKLVSAAEAKAVPRDSIAEISVTGFDGVSAVTMSIRTKGHATVIDTVRYRPSLAVRGMNGSTGEPRVIRDLPSKDQPMIILDGKRADNSVLRSLNPNQIAKMEVLKGEAAKTAYGADGKNGVIVITTKQ